MGDSNTKGSGKILVVEDEETLRTLFSNFLGVLKYDADIASSTDEAHKLLRGNGVRQEYWCVFSDNRAPEQDAGIELLTSLGSSGYKGRRILMSGADVNGLQPGVQTDSGICDVFLAKPFSYRTLDAVLREQQGIYAALRSRN